MSPIFLATPSSHHSISLAVQLTYGPFGNGRGPSRETWTEPLGNANNDPVLIPLTMGEICCLLLERQDFEI